jgi:hypothetical protein
MEAKNESKYYEPEASMPFLYIAGFLCAAPTTINNTKFPWNAEDTKQIAISQRRCVEKYRDTSPCLKTLYKIGERDYKAVCAKALKEQND